MRGMKSQAPSAVLQAIFILSKRTYICQSHRIAFRWAGLAALSPRFASVHARLCVPVAAFCLGSWPVLRSCRGVLPSAHGWPCVPVAALCPRLTPVFFLLEEKETACDSLRFLFRRVEIAIRAFSSVGAVICLCGFTSGLAVSLWRSRRGYRGRGVRGERSRRRGVSALSRNHIGFAMFSTGSTLGLRAPDCAKESSTLWTLFI